MDMNPFRKDISIHKLYESNDYRQMTNRLDFLIRCKGIGLFIGNPGMGKTTCIRSLLDGLNTSRYKVVYICLTTITPLEFYRTLNDELGLEESHKKNILFRQIQSELERLSKEHMEVVIVIDEAQFLSEMVLKEFTIQAISKGSDDVGKVHMQVEHDGHLYYGFGANTDIVTASVEAYIDCINKFKK